MLAHGATGGGDSYARMEGGGEGAQPHNQRAGST